MRFAPHKWEGELLLRALWPWEELQRASRKQLYEVRSENLAFISDKYGRVEIPQGFITDFASVPRLLLPYLDDDAPQALAPALPHDFNYSRAGTVSKAAADEMIEEGMLSCGARPTQAAVVRKMVGWFGGGHWKK